MKRIIALFLSFSSIGLVGLTGCGKKEGTTGGPGAADPNAKPPLVGRQEDTFALNTSSTTVHAGGKMAETSIGIKRGKGFDQDVSVELNGAPSGVKVEPMKVTIPKGATEAKLSVTAADEATPGEYKVKVTGKPGSGPESNVDLVITVQPRASFSLDPPGNALWSAGVKQAEIKHYTVAISRDKEFTDDVTIKFDNVPKGVSIEPASPVIKNGESEVSVVVKATADAPVGS